MTKARGNIPGPHAAHRHFFRDQARRQCWNAMRTYIDMYQFRVFLLVFVFRYPVYQRIVGGKYNERLINSNQRTSGIERSLCEGYGDKIRS